MDYDLEQQCDQHPDRYHCPDMLISYTPKYREYGLIVHDGGHSKVIIEYCPWCGTQLPSSLRDEWFDRIDQLGLVPGDPAIPEPMESETWWRAEQSQGPALPADHRLTGARVAEFGQSE
jgi:hypothetical protein